MRHRSNSFALAPAAFAWFALVLPVGPGSALADDGPHDDAIEARQGMFQQFGFNLGILGDMAKEKRPYDAELAQASADNLDLATSIHQNAYWPEGSDDETDGNRKNRALPEIWENQADVQEKFADLRSAVEKLVPVAGNGVDALGGAVGDVGGACKSCHDEYRAERR